jgi:C-terminal processing protease CtpA/Prc
MTARWFALTALCLVPTSVQEPKLEGPALEAVIEELATKLETNYIFPDVARSVAEHLRQRLFDGAYEGLDLAALAGRISTDLKKVNGDGHLNAWPLPQENERRAAPTEEERARQQREHARRTNHGFKKLEILEGNIGYLELTGFASAEVAGETAVAAMAFFANVDALVIDLRANGGGDPSMLQLLCSYFFAERTLLDRFERRGVAQLEEYWTLPHVPGKKLIDVPIFLLTSNRTFSCAEEFSYDLRNLERARLFGETTGGGAHPGSSRDIAGKLMVFIPDGRALNPITGTNWEKVGVQPHVAVPASQALDRALAEARTAAEARRSKPE